MKFSTAVIAAVAAFLPAIEAHMRITDPVPYNGGNNAPLDPSGSNFPCMLNKGESYPALGGNPKVYTPGQPCNFQITGGATHGGGSCQVSISYNLDRSEEQVFKVIKSWHGGCPTESNLDNRSGNPDDNSSDPFTFELPDGLPAGEAVFAWTWFNRIGNREMYMNCAPIKIGGNGKDFAMYNKLPDIFVANLEIPASQCTTNEREDIMFPNPGANCETATTGPNLNLKPACGGAAPVTPAPAPVTGNKGNNGNQQQQPPQNGGEQYDDGRQLDSGDDEYFQGKPVLVDVGTGNNQGNNQGNQANEDDEDESYGGETGSGSGSDNSSNNGSNSGNYGNNNNSQVDDNTGSFYGQKFCRGSKQAIACNGVETGKYVMCHGKNLGWLYDLPGDCDCKTFAARYPFLAQAKFKRHAFEHAKRLARRHHH